MVSQAHSPTKADDQSQMFDTKSSDEIRSVAGASIVCLDLVDSTNAEALRIAPEKTAARHTRSERALASQPGRQLPAT